MKILRNSYVILILLVLLFLAPGMSAYFVFHHQNWLSAQRTNKGTLLSPPVQVQALKGQAKWQLVLWSPTACTDTCIKDLDRLARIRLALGRHLYEVNFSLLLGQSTRGLSKKTATTLHEEDIHVLKLADQVNEPSLPDKSQVYLVNPDGFLVLSYELDTSSRDIYHDLKRLLNIKEQ